MLEDIPQTTNSGWGFYGTMHTMGANAEKAWPIAFNSIKKATKCSTAEVLAFLDSRSGRHFADDVSNYMLNTKKLDTAINSATEKWMSWTMDREIREKYGIPSGTPYLTGFVVVAGIESEEEENNVCLPVKPNGLDINIEILETIAQKTLGIETLQVRKSDSLDFHDLGVWSIKDALELAYKTGMDAGLGHYAVSQSEETNNVEPSKKVNTHKAR